MKNHLSRLRIPGWLPSLAALLAALLAMWMASRYPLRTLEPSVDQEDEGLEALRAFTRDRLALALDNIDALQTRLSEV